MIESHPVNQIPVDRMLFVANEMALAPVNVFPITLEIHINPVVPNAYATPTVRQTRRVSNKSVAILVPAPVAPMPIAG